MWLSSLTPFPSSSRPEILSASEAALKATLTTAQTAAATGATESVSVTMSQIAAHILELNKPADAGRLPPDEAQAARIIALNKPIDVGSMTAEQAKARYDQLTGMLRYGGYENMGVAAVLGDQETGSMETFLRWLEERGRNADPHKMSNPATIDLKA